YIVRIQLCVEETPSEVAVVSGDGGGLLELLVPVEETAIRLGIVLDRFELDFRLRVCARRAQEVVQLEIFRQRCVGESDLAGSRRMHQREQQDTDRGEALLAIDHDPGERIFRTADYCPEEVFFPVLLQDLLDVVE